MSSEPRPSVPRIIRGAQIGHDRFVVTHLTDGPPPAPPVPEGPSPLERMQAEGQAIIKKAQQQAAAQLSAAQAETSRLLAEAEHKIQQLEQQAYQQGFQAGEAAGKAHQLASLTQAQNLLQGAHTERERLLKGAETEVIQLVLSIAKRLLHTEPIINEEVILAVVRQALQRLGQQVEVELRVNLAEAELLHYNLNQLQDLALEIVIEPDPNVSPGGCLLRSRAGSLEALLDHQFAIIEQSFLAVADDLL